VGGSSRIFCSSGRRRRQVNLIYDSLGAFGTPKTFFDRLTQAGVQVLEFNPAVTKPWTLNNRDHRKLLVVDGRTAFLGGINISSVYSSGSSARGSERPADATGGWRDTDIQVEGPVVGEFRSIHTNLGQTARRRWPGKTTFPRSRRRART
jgi:cardiolipin synthase